VTCRSRLLSRYGTILVHVSMRDTQVCHVLPPLFLCAVSTTLTFLYSLSDR
jgi:hypothetical protein